MLIKQEKNCKHYVILGGMAILRYAINYLKPDNNGGCFCSVCGAHLTKKQALDVASAISYEIVFGGFTNEISKED